MLNANEYKGITIKNKKVFSYKSPCLLYNTKKK